MNSPRAYWPRWSAALRRHDLQHLATTLLEAFAPVTFLGAQLLHFGGGFLNSDELAALAATLEEGSERGAFAMFLTEEHGG
jgi:hypothetical protein